MNTLYIVRGVSGAGKTSMVYNLIENLPSSYSVAADDYFALKGEYHFDPTKLRNAHAYCFANAAQAMEDGIQHVFVHNTFTKEWEWEKYVEAAEVWGYRVVFMVIENRHEGENVHGVPAEKVQQMKNRFEIQL